MLHPTIDELTEGKYNRYELALATARCARLITDEYVRQHDVAEKNQTGNKETDRPVNTMIDRELRDEKAVKVAIGRIYKGIYQIDLHAEDHPETRRSFGKPATKPRKSLRKRKPSARRGAKSRKIPTSIRKFRLSNESQTL